MDNQEQSESARNWRKDPKKEPQHIPVSVNITNKNYWGNSAAVASVIVSIILAVVTWRLYHEAVSQSANAKSSADAAFRAANAAITSDSISIAAYKWDSTRSEKASFEDSRRFKKQFDFANKSLERNMKANDARFELDSESSDKQIKAMQDAAKENINIAKNSNLLVEDENRAFISFDSVAIDTTGKAFYVWDKMLNVGKTTAYKVKGRSICVISKDTTFLNANYISNFEAESFTSANITLGTGRHVHGLWPTEAEMAKEQYDLWKSDTSKKIYIIGAYSYEDIYKRPHFAHFFGEYRIATKDVAFLYQYNDSD